MPLFTEQVLAQEPKMYYPFLGRSPQFLSSVVEVSFSVFV